MSRALVTVTKFGPRDDPPPRVPITDGAEVFTIPATFDDAGQFATGSIDCSVRLLAQDGVTPVPGQMIATLQLYVLDPQNRDEWIQTDLPKTASDSQTVRFLMGPSTTKDERFGYIRVTGLEAINGPQPATVRLQLRFGRVRTT